jgi:hypothetical protein
VRYGRKVDKKCTVWEGFQRVGGRLEGEPCLPDASEAGQGDEPRTIRANVVPEEIGQLA